MGNWVIYEQTAWFGLRYSTQERRVVTVKNNAPLYVQPIGVFRIPPFCRYDSLAFVNMTPKHVEVGIKGNAGTTDGVAVEGRVTVQALVREDESLIKRMAVDAEGEERLLRDCIVTAIQGKSLLHARGTRSSLLAKK